VDPAQVEFYFLYTDGAARGNPGPSGAGWVLCNPQEDEVLSGHQFLGHRTNNQAEYEAVIYGLEAIADCEIENIVIRADSQLMVRQLLGEYRVKNVDLKPLHAKALQLLSTFTQVKIEHIRREYNVPADRQANLALDLR
jgi:ribonuclease HI